MFLDIDVKKLFNINKLRFESGKGFELLDSENAMRTAAVQEC